MDHAKLLSIKHPFCKLDIHVIYPYDSHMIQSRTIQHLSNVRTSFSEEELSFQEMKCMSSYWLVKNVFFIYEELNKYEKPYSSEKVQGFGHQQCQVLLMKSGAAEFTLVSWALGRLVPKYIEFAYCLLPFIFFFKSPCHSDHLCLYF